MGCNRQPHGRPLPLLHDKTPDTNGLCGYVANIDQPRKEGVSWATAIAEKHNTLVRLRLKTDAQGIDKH